MEMKMMNCIKCPNIAMVELFGSKTSGHYCWDCYIKELERLNVSK